LCQASGRALDIDAMAACVRKRGADNFPGLLEIALMEDRRC
jgi:hypothetical protein